MLHAIRTLWTLTAIAAILAVVHLGFYGTEMGARLAVHDALARDFGETWDRWIDYSISKGDGQYDVLIRPLPGVSDNEAPENWRSRARDWWNSPPPASDSLTLTVRSGQVWFGPAQGAPAHSFGVGPHMASMNLVYAALVLGAIALLVAFILGKLVDQETREKQYHRPGSILDRTPGASSRGR